MSLELQITFDCADPDALAHFWADALGYELQPPPNGFDSWDAALQAWSVPEQEWNSRSAAIPSDGGGPRLFFQRVPESKAGKNRVHLDIRAAPDLIGDDRMAALATESERLVALGAEVAYRVEPDGGMETGFITMRDPEGNEFCLD